MGPIDVKQTVLVLCQPAPLGAVYVVLRTYLVGVSDDECALFWEVVVEV